MSMIMYCLGLPVAYSATLLSSNPAVSFHTFINLYSRHYQRGSKEYDQRQQLFLRRSAAALRHNSQAGRRWTAGVNEMWDWTDEELAQLNGWRGGRQSKTNGGQARPGTVSLQQHGVERKQLPE